MSRYDRNTAFTLRQMNAELEKIQDSIDTMLDREGTEPNEMLANVDMNNNRILNLPDAINSQEPATLSQLLNTGDFTVAIADAKYYDTVALATSDTSLQVDDVVVITERNNAVFKAIAYSGPNLGYELIDADDNSLTLELTSSYYNATEWGLGLGLGASWDTAGFQRIVQSDRAITFPAGTYEFSNLSFKGLKNVVLIGDGRSTTVFDFLDVASGTALDLGFDGVSGGTQRISFVDIGFTDSRSVSLVDTMILLESGITGQSPAQTSAYFNFTRCGIIKYNNINGIGRNIKDVSHVTTVDWRDEFENGMGESLVLENTKDINTGVYSFYNEEMRAKKRCLRINPTFQLMDTINFDGGFIGNFTNSDAVECCLIEGSKPVASLNFKGIHWENRHDSQIDIIRVEGAWRGGSFIGNHLSGGTDSKKTLYGINVVGSAIMDAVAFDANEILRLENRGSGGAVFHFENTVTTDIESKIKLGEWFFNTTTPDLVLVDTGGNEDTIYKSLIGTPQTVNRLAVGYDRMYELEDSATPSVLGGVKFEISSVSTNTTITDFVDEYRGQQITLVNTGGGNLTVQNGANTIRCEGGVDLNLTNFDSVQFVRTQSGNHWIQVGPVVST